MIQTLEHEIRGDATGPSTDYGLQRIPEIQPAPSPASAPKQRPRLGCAGLIRRGDEVLLGKRNKEPNRGLWVLPGGGVEFCESFAKTLARELAEEAGIQIDVKGVFNVFELINPPS
ncbi:MAG: NUDIX domain-containing protein, partial [Verrucomicrobiota bacterium]